MSEYTDKQLDRIDRLVAEHVMGWQQGSSCGVVYEDWQPLEQPISADGWYCSKCGHSEGWGDNFEHETAHPQYTRDRAAAMLVFESCKEAGWLLAHAEDHDGYFVGRVDWMSEDWWVFAEAPTPMLAICLAALKRQGVEVPDGS